MGGGKLEASEGTACTVSPESGDGWRRGAGESSAVVESGGLLSCSEGGDDMIL